MGEPVQRRDEIAATSTHSDKVLGYAIDPIQSGTVAFLIVRDSDTRELDRAFIEGAGNTVTF